MKNGDKIKVEMNLEKVIDEICKAVNEYLESKDFDIKTDENTVMLGKNSVLDSIGLVNVIVDIESKFLDDGIEISLTSEKAMSRKNSPFRTIETLAEFIKEQINENNE